MTAQAGERLTFKGEEIWMAAEPLNQYLKYKNNIKFVSPSTACWRGYWSSPLLIGQFYRMVCKHKDYFSILHWQGTTEGDYYTEGLQSVYL